ncbi:MAG: DUF1801 domain-containing protein [Candidatus Saccharibacteria bacterium]
MKPTEKIDLLIASLTDWRGPMLARLRQLFHEADSGIVEEWKYMGSPCWYHSGGLVVVGNAFKTKVSLGFLYGASLPDPDSLFNAELAGNQRRAVEFHDGDKINEESLKTLIRAAIAHNQAKKAARLKN